MMTRWTHTVLCREVPDGGWVIVEAINGITHPLWTLH